MEAKIPLAKIYEHDLGIPDSHILGSKNIPFHVLLWRNQRVYYFTFSKPTENSAQRIKDLIARFRTREATKCRTNRASASPTALSPTTARPPTN
ncbi:hypothetical protein P4133_29270 [Pseudomonas aeruginosa]|nr:hypothetical protein [Pseudomonas aeruginosa]